MKSPFPGMDPYIEAYGLWGDFHDELIVAIKHALGKVLPDRYFLQIRQRSYIVFASAGAEEAKLFYADVTVGQEGNGEGRPAHGAPLAIAEPAASATGLSMRAFVEEHIRESFLEINQVEPERRLVTAIEVLSPSNKRRGTKGWKIYLRKRKALLLGKGSLVEIDLLRGGQRMPMIDPWPDSPYYLLVGWKRSVPTCKVWPIHYRQPLPPIPIPLADPDPDLSLSLQPLIDAVYERSRYGRRIDYRKPLNPPLVAADVAWLAKEVQSRGK
jgi:hypothetical protein